MSDRFHICDVDKKGGETIVFDVSSNFCHSNMRSVLSASRCMKQILGHRNVINNSIPKYSSFFRNRPP